MPGQICAVAICKNNQDTLKKLGSNISFHRFPNNRDFVTSTIRKEWIRRCQRADKFNVETSRMCSDHFTSNYYERDMKNELLGLPLKKILKKTAVPTINLGRMITGATEQTTRAERATKREKKEIVNTLLASTSKAPSVNMNLSTVGNSFIKSDNPVSHIPVSHEIEPCLDATEIRQNVSSEDGAQDQEKKENIYKKKYQTLLRKYNNLKMTSREKIKGLNAMLTYYKKKTTEVLIWQQIRHSSSKIVEKSFYEKSDVYYLVLKKGSLDSRGDIFGIHFKVLQQEVLCVSQEELELSFTIIFEFKALGIPFTDWSWTTDVLLMMKLAGEDFTECERTVVLHFDEVKIKSVQEYDVAKDQVLGPHSQMQVIQARGLFSKWKQPVFVAFDQKVTKNILVNIITELHNISYNVVACVSDCGGGNVGLWTELQVDINKIGSH